MRTCYRRLTLVLLLSALFTGQTIAETVPDDVSCGDDYWFKITDLVGWRSEWRSSGESISLLMAPEAASRTTATMLFSLEFMGRPEGNFEIEDALQTKLSLMNAFGSPTEIRAFKIHHRTLPTAGASLVFAGGTSHVAAIDVGTFGRSHFIAMLAKPEGEPSPSDFKKFQETIDSIDFDPTRGCQPGKNGELVVVRLLNPDPPPDEGDPKRTTDFDLSSAASGCKMLSRLYVPVDCELTEVAGEETLLVRFGADDRYSPDENLRLFSGRVATPFCYEAKQNPSHAPRLAFASELESNGKLYDCDTRKFVSDVPAALSD